MRVNRAKAVRKALQFFQIVFGLDKAVYHVILDGNFIYAGIKYKVDMLDRLRTLLQGAEVKIYVLQSVLEELKQAGAKTKAALEYAKSCCDVIDDSAFGGGEVNDRVLSMMSQQHEEWKTAPGKRRRKYLVATQDKGLRGALARIPGIPLIYLNKVILVLEPPSSASREFNLKTEADKVALRPGSAEAALMDNLKKRKGGLGVSSIIDGSAAAPVDNGNSDDGGGGGGDGGVAKPAERKKHKALAANPLASMAPSHESHKQNKLRKDKFRR